MQQVPICTDSSNRNKEELLTALIVVKMEVVGVTFWSGVASSISIYGGTVFVLKRAKSTSKCHGIEKYTFEMIRI